MSDQKFDIVIIGTGAGGGTLLSSLAPTGKKILVVERGDYIPKEKENWDTEEVFVNGRYKTKDEWLDSDGKAFHPGQHYCVGGNTKVYGAALFRLRERDFEKIEHKGGVSPSWPISYADMKDYYQQAEELYHVHGERKTDPTEPSESRPYLHAPIPHEPRVKKLYEDLEELGLQPFPLPLGLRENDDETAHLVLDRFDGFPDPTESKADSHVVGVKPSLAYDNVTLWCNSEVIRLNHDATGKKIEEVIILKENEEISVNADLFCLSAGAINSAALLLQSSSEKYPNGLGNGSNMLGRNYMCHNNTALVALSVNPNPTKFGKTFALNDFYFGSEDYEFPMGQIQMLGKSDATMFKDDAPSFAPGMTLDYVAKHALDFWITSEDLPDPDNRVEVKNGKLVLHYKENNLDAHKKLVKKCKQLLEKAGCQKHWLPNNIYLGKKIPIAGVAHQCGTVVMGNDPEKSVLNSWCQSHEISNLFVVDGGFFPSSSAVNPGLTIMAMALRVGDYIKSEILE